MQDPGSARARGQVGCSWPGLWGAFSNPLLLGKLSCVGGGGEPPLGGKNELDIVILQ